MEGLPKTSISRYSYGARTLEEGKRKAQLICQWLSDLTDASQNGGKQAHMEEESAKVQDNRVPLPSIIKLSCWSHFLNRDDTIQVKIPSTGKQ